MGNSIFARGGGRSRITESVGSSRDFEGHPKGRAEIPGYPDGYGKPLGNFAGSKLAGLYKIKFKKAGLRVVYALQRMEERMVVVIISARADDFVYYEAEKRRKKHDL